MKRRIILLTLLIPLYQAAAKLPDPSDIMNKSRELSLTGALSARISLSITEKNGSMRSRTISMTTKSFSDGLEKRFIKFLDPPDVKGTSMLIHDYRDIADEMWIYLPALKKTRRIVSSDKGKSFMNSEFSNADMSSPATTDFVHKHLSESGKNKHWIIESTPVDEDKAEEYGYSRKVSHIGMEDLHILKMEFYNFDNELFKTIDIKKTHNLNGGKYMISEMIASNLLTSRKSEIVMSGIIEGAMVDDSVFSLQNLER